MERLRKVEMFAGRRRYTLTTWDTNRRRQGSQHWLLGYVFRGPDGVLFSGEDFGCSPVHAVDSDAALRSLLGFLTLKPGDTDDDYFDRYTPRQMAFAVGEAEELALYADEDDPYPLVDAYA